MQTKDPRVAPKSRGHLAEFAALAGRHVEAFWYVLTVILPAIIRTGKKPVVFTKYSGIGDIICTLPAALELKKRHAGREIIYNCFEEYACLPRLGGVTGHVTYLKETMGLIGYWYRFLLNGYYHFVSEDDAHVDHTVLYVKEFGSVFGVTVDGSHPRLEMNPAVVGRVSEILKERGIDAATSRMVVIHPGPTLPVKEWPHERWVDLVRALRRDGFSDIVHVGLGKVLRFGDVGISEIPDAVPIVNVLTLEETITLISLGKLFVGVDSGLLHAAVSVGTAAVGLWGATSPRFLYSAEESRSSVVSTVECQGCHHRQPVLHWDTGCPYDIRCMKSIQVEEVLQVCLSRLETAVT